MPPFPSSNSTKVFNIPEAPEIQVDGESADSEPIAIIGIGCRFPGAHGPTEFWELLRNGVDAITDIPTDRFDVDAMYDPRPAIPGKLVSRRGGFISDPYGFDNAFFSISPREALRMDPQHRVLLEVAWEAMEDAGLVSETTSGMKAGVFVGLINNDYKDLLVQHPSLFDVYASVGISGAMAAGRISFALGFQGPSVTIDTACSSSLVAVHQACQSLLQNECELALAGGVNLVLMPTLNICFSQSGMLAPDGRCKFGDATADGFIRSDGAGVVVLKKLRAALQDKDRIYAVIRGSAVNNDGRSGGLLMTPSSAGQAAVLRAACHSARIEPGRLQYVEAHGTGTQVGDPIEIETLGRILAIGRPEDDICLLGSIKTNIGHTESAAGIASVIKVALSLRHRNIPPSLHFNHPNTRVPWEKIPVSIPLTVMSWPERGDTRLAGINSFGLSGTNAHVILESVPESPRQEEGVVYDDLHLLTLSARSSEALKALVVKYQELLLSASDISDLHLKDVCYTASVRRMHHEHRLAVVGQSISDIAERLQSFIADETHPFISSGRIRPNQKRKVVFVFPGQGSQWLGMGVDLFAKEPVFRRTIEECQQAFQKFVDWSLIDELHADEHHSHIARLEVVQPVLFALDVALAKLWSSWGIVPDAVVGHSMGEVAAAHIAGALCLEDAARIICRRSQLATRITGRGGMATVGLPLDETRKVLQEYENQLSVAVSNGPSSTVISGDATTLDQFIQDMENRGVFVRRVVVDFASHSPQVDQLRTDLMDELAFLNPQAASTPIYSTVTGQESDGAGFDKEYWFRNLRSPVLFWPVIQRLLDQGYDTFLEISPHPILLSAIQQGILDSDRDIVTMPTLRRKENERAMMLASLATLYAKGVVVNWESLYPQHGRVIGLPLYPWQHQKYSFDSQIEASDQPGHFRLLHSNRHPIIGDVLVSATHPDIYFWEERISLERLPYLKDHRVQDAVILPATMYLDAIFVACEALFGKRVFILEEVKFAKALFLSEAERIIQVVIEQHEAEGASFKIFSRLTTSPAKAGAWTLHVEGMIKHHAQEQSSLPHEPSRLLDDLHARCNTEVSSQEFYATAAQHGLLYGPAFQGVIELNCGNGEALGKVQPPADITGDVGHYVLHPALFDACLQVVMATIVSEHAAGHANGVHIPVGIERMVLQCRPSSALQSYAVRLMSEDNVSNVIDRLPRANVLVFGDDGQIALEVKGLRLQRIDQVINNFKSSSIEDWIYTLQWEKWEPSKENVKAQPAGSEGGTWIILEDEGNVGQDLARLLSQAGGHPIRVRQGSYFEVDEQSSNYRINPLNGNEFHQLVTDITTKYHMPLRGLIHLWNLDIPQAKQLAQDSFQKVLAPGVITTLHILQAIYPMEKELRLWIVTGGVQTIQGEKDISVSQAPVWGLGRVITNEHPSLDCTLVDLADERSTYDAQALYEELSRGDRELQVALRGTERFVARLDQEHSNTTQASVEQELRTMTVSLDYPFRLENITPGILDGLALYATNRLIPLPGWVEIKVQATAMNFIDVMSAMGMVPNYGRFEGPLGIECSGVIVAVGEGVDTFKIGDEVVALAPNCIGSYATTDAYCVAFKPPEISFEEAATIPIAYVTAYYSLVHLARIRRGERVLIHSAAGGVGLAAVQICQLFGAEIFATAGTEEKREYLRSLGITYVMDSHTLSWADDIRRYTQDQGIDVVLNSLAGEAIPRGIDVLRSYGRFVEIGKRDIYSNRQLNLYPFRSNLSFFAVNLDSGTREAPQLFGSVLGEVMHHFHRGELGLLPSRVFPITESINAFRHMAMGKHIGKVVLSLQAEEVTIRADAHGSLLRADSTYLITGGLGGLGLVIARWMAEQGVRNIVLIGRRAPTTQAEAQIKEMREMGAQVIIETADVADEEQMGVVFSRLHGMVAPPLRGIFHCAMVLDDSILVQLDADRFAKVMAPKVKGAWNLHCLTRSEPLDFFVMFSSAASLLGSPGQGNYAAGNAFLDALAYQRRLEGLPGVSINWGPWSEAGEVARKNLSERLGTRGLQSIASQQGLEALRKLLVSHHPQVAVIPFDADLWAEHYPSAAGSSFFAHLTKQRNIHDDMVETSPAARVLKLLLREEDNHSEAYNLVQEFLSEYVSRILGLSTKGHLDQDQPLTALGIDSLMAVELKNRIQLNLNVELPVTVILAGLTVGEMSKQIIQHMMLTVEKQKAEVSEKPVVVSRDGGATVVDDGQDLDPLHELLLLDRLDDLSDAEVDKLLAGFSKEKEAMSGFSE